MVMPHQQVFSKEVGSSLLLLCILFKFWDGAVYTAASHAHCPHSFFQHLKAAATTAQVCGILHGPAFSLSLFCSVWLLPGLASLSQPLEVPEKPQVCPNPAWLAT